MSQPATILIIDDDPGMCETVEDVLRVKGHAVETATRGGDGLEKLRARLFDAAIVDIKLPDISGLDLLKAIKASSPDTEVIFVTGYAALQTAIQAINGAAFAYVVKPFEMDHLLATLAKALEKQRVTRALQESEERYRLITETINDALLLVDLDGRLVFGNRRGEEITGYRMEELRGRPVFSLLTPEGAQQVATHLEAGRTGQGIPPIFETEVVRKDGSRVWVEAAFTNVVKEGRVVGRLGVARDITERKQLQESLVQAEKLATLGELIAGIAHELNNPLSAMVGHAQLLKMGEKDPKTAARADRILEAAQRATRIVRNFLTLVRQHAPEKTAVPVNDVITKTLDLLAYQLRVSDIALETALAPDLPVIAGDPHQLQQVILNLLHNAVQAMAATHRPGSLRVESALTPDRASIRVTVVDDGPGIASEHLPRLFEPFFTTKPPGKGTGLGLAIAKGIVTEHAGTLTVESAPGRGATFVITLPVSVSPPVRTAPALAATIPAGLRVLLVDDELPLGELMSEALVGRGARVEVAASGREALDILPHAPVDVLVLDVRMPGMTGTDLWDQINRTNPALARRTVFCTGDVLTEEIRAFIASTGCITLSKPFELSQLFDAVGRAASC